MSKMVRAGDLLSQQGFSFSEPSPIQTRLIEGAVDIRSNPPDEISYQHSVLCQTSLPYRHTEARRWEKRNGRVMLEIEAGRAYHPEKEEFFDLPLPFGPKARLILIHLNSEAVRTQSKVIEVEDSLTAFVRLLGGREPNGREITRFKDQLSALSAAHIRMATAVEGRAFQVNTNIVHKFDLWFPKDQNQRILWPSTVELGTDYFDTLINHAVPLDQRAVCALSHSSMALDIYQWLAQRLYRVPKSDSRLVPWVNLQQQFGADYERIRKFREVFLNALREVLTQYPSAAVVPSDEGLILKNSTPPIRPARLIAGV
jgi:hypothetical protein